MSSLHLYDTTYGKLIDTNAIQVALNRYIAVAGVDTLSYEYMTKGSRLVFITGKNREEQDLPIWTYPLSFTTLGGDSVVCVDLRKYVRKHDEDSFVYLADIVKDTSSVDFLVLLGMLLVDNIDKYMGNHVSIQKGVCVGFGNWLAKMINNLVLLTPVEFADVEIAMTYYAQTMFYKTDDISTVTANIVSMVATSKLSLRTPRKYVESVVDKLDTKGPSINTLVEYLHAVLPDNKGSNINTETIMILTKGLFFGPGESGIVLMALENPAAWIAMLYSCLTDKTYKRSRLATMLTANGNNINKKLVELHLSNYVKDRTVGI